MAASDPHATVLDFGEKFFAKMDSVDEYIAAVDSALAAHQAPTVDSLKIFFEWKYGDFSITVNPVNRILSWVAFAKLKRVRDFEAKISLPPGIGLRIPGPALHSEVLTRLSLRGCNIDPPFDPLKVPSLQELSLKDARITDETLASILANCPDLTTLTLASCCGLHEVKISLPLRLESLKIKKRCSDVRRVEIDAPGLKSLDLSMNYSEEDVKFILKDVSGLQNAKVILPYKLNLQMRWALLSALAGVEDLCLFGPLVQRGLSSLIQLGEFPQLTFAKLKRIFVEVRNTYRGLPDFLNFCKFPALEHLSIVYLQMGSDHLQRVNWELPTSARPFPKLKAAIIGKFTVCRDHLMMAEFILQRAVSLETLLVPVEARKLLPGADAKHQIPLEALPKANSRAEIVLFPDSPAFYKFI